MRYIETVLFIKMNYEFAKPSIVLQPYIKQYWAIENALDKGTIHSQRVIATGLPELLFYFGNRPTSDQRIIEGNTLLNGQQNDYYDLLISDTLSMFTITFHPSGLSHFLKIPLSELQNQTLLFEYIDKASSQQLEEQLWEATSFRQRIEIVEAYFLKRLNNQPISVDHQRMIHTTELIKSSKGIVSIDFLASKACLSRKQYERKFLAHIGISPKQFLKIIRFQNAIHLKQLNLSLTELAFETGYYDQSHFINEVKELTGQTPKKLFANGEIISDFFR